MKRRLVAILAATVLLALILGGQALTLLALVVGAVRKRLGFMVPYLVLQSISLGPLVAILSDSAASSSLSSGGQSNPPGAPAPPFGSVGWVTWGLPPTGVQ